MKKSTKIVLAMIALGTTLAAPVHAGGLVTVTLGVPAYYPAPVVVTVPPMYAVPVVVMPPPPVVYCPPRPVCTPVVVAPPCHAWGRYDYDRDRDRDRRGWGHRDRDVRGYRGGWCR
jgi:hypothetical protein